jgi:U3 small nucleolar RNA-associated protein 23
VATQSQPLRVGLKKIPAVPVVHINRSVMVLEPPSDTTLKAKEDVSIHLLSFKYHLYTFQADEKALRPTHSELSTLPSKAPIELPKKRKGPKGPNPLSVKKKKPAENSATTSKGKGKQRDPPHHAVGEKRKRGVEEEVESKDVSQPNTTEHDGNVQGGHKRKRRRKNHDKAGETSTVVDP